MNDLHLKYKQDTGLKSEICECFGSFEDDILAEDVLPNDYFYHEGNKAYYILKIPSPEYVKWLENKLEGIK